MAIIYVSPDTDITALIASAEVLEGDVLLLSKGIYNQAVVISKNYVRVVAKDCGAVFDGLGLLANAFSLNGVTGVEIHGVTIRNYVANGIDIIGGTANRIIFNTISDITGAIGRGITVSSSTANLIWNNRIRNVWDGVELIGGSTHNWVLENKSETCSDDGFESFLSVDRDNAFIGNIAVNCGGNCYEIFGINNLVYRNVAVDGSAAGFLFVDPNSLAIDNKAEKGNFGMQLSSLNTFAAQNELRNNSGTGLNVITDFNIIFRNLIAFNRNSGLVLGANADDNLIYFNKVVCNTPENIVEGGTDNNYLRNITGCRSDCSELQND